MKGFIMPNEALLKDIRAELFKAVARGDVTAVRDLLRQAPELMTIRSDFLDLTLLHSAAGNGHSIVCDYLISNGHEMHPLNKLGVTPYQWTSSPDVRSFLSNRQLSVYVTEYALIRRDNTVTRENEFKALTDAEFDEIAGERHALHSLIQRDEDCDYVYFRADSLMQPYIGPLFVIYENLVLTHLYNNASGLELLPVDQAYFCIVCIDHAVQHFPFLSSQLNDEDERDIQSAKILFNEAFIERFAVAYEQCSEEEQGQLALLRQTINAIELMAALSHSDNSGIVLRLNG